MKKQNETNQTPRPQRYDAGTIKKRTERICCAVLVCVVLLISLALLVLDRPLVSETENRELATFPEFSLAALLDGSYTAGIITYFTDTVPFREALRDAGISMSELFGIRLGGVRIHGPLDTLPPEDDVTDAPPPVTTDTPVTDTAPVTDTPVTDAPVTGTAPITDASGTSAAVTEPPVTTPQVTTPQVTEPPVTTPPVTEPPAELPDIEDVLRQNSIIVLNKRGIMLYGGSKSNAATYAESLNAYKAQLPSANVWSMVIPTAVAYYLPEKYAAYTRSQKEHIEYITPLLSGVGNVDAYGALKSHVSENIYTRTDHHWATLGAYYAAAEFAKTAAVPFADLSSYKKVEREGYVGTLYTYSEDVVLKNNPETFVYYKPQNDYSTRYYNRVFENGYDSALFFDWVSVSASYCVFLGSDDCIAEIKTDCGNGRVLMVIKDSYGNALIPFLTGSFETIYVVDYRYFELNAVDFAAKHGVTDLLVATCAFSACGPAPSYLEYMRTK